MHICCLIKSLRPQNHNHAPPSGYLYSLLYTVEQAKAYKPAINSQKARMLGIYFHYSALGLVC